MPTPGSRRFHLTVPFEEADSVTTMTMPWIASLTKDDSLMGDSSSTSGTSGTSLVEDGPETANTVSESEGSAKGEVEDMHFSALSISGREQSSCGDVLDTLTTETQSIFMPTDHQISQKFDPLLKEKSRESSAYQFRQVRKIYGSHINTGYFQSSGKSTLTSPPRVSPKYPVLEGDLFIHRAIDSPGGPQVWIRAATAKSARWTGLAIGSERMIGSELRVLFIAEDGTPNWVKPETQVKYRRRSDNIPKTS
jgi:hypothetical protein